VPLRIFADDALRESFTELAAAFGNLTPGVQVELVFGSSADLVDRLRQGQRADAVALVGDAPIRELIDAGLIEESQATPFAEDRLAVVTLRGSDAASLEVLARPGVRLALARAGTPLGDAARRSLERMVAAPPTAWAASAPQIDALLGAALAYDDVPAIIVALRADEVDAAFLFESAVTPQLEGELRRIPIPSTYNQPLRYAIAPLTAAAHLSEAQQFVDLVTDAPGQATLSAYNFYSAIDSSPKPALEVGGAVERPYELTAAQLAQLPQVEVEAPDGSGQTRRFVGVSLGRLIEGAQPLTGTQTMILHAEDNSIQKVPLAFVRTCVNCVVATLEDGSLQAILPGYSLSAWVRRLVQLEVE
jgi:molybdate transport system substrate-binding protein